MFCGRARPEVRKLVHGPGVFICDSCVSACLHAVDPGDDQAVSSGETWIHPPGLDPPAALQEAGGPIDPCAPHCSFCGRRREEVTLLIRSYLRGICEDCLGLCRDIVAREPPDV
jgi:ATP-dependent protease Clp ATPase subunit